MPNLAVSVEVGLFGAWHENQCPLYLVKSGKKNYMQTKILNFNSGTQKHPILIMQMKLMIINTPTIIQL